MSQVAMTMRAYLDESDYALRNLISAVWQERHEVDALSAELDALRRRVEDGYRRGEAIALNAEDADDVMLAASAQWDTYFGDDKDAHEVASKLDLINQRLAVREFSATTLSGALLQIGKQAISIVHGQLSIAPAGRLVGTQSLKTVIWQGRNQALHWESGAFHPPVDECFHQLGPDFGAPFSQYKKRNMAFEIVRVLGWASVEAVRNDLESLA